jgi:Tfp pilus assembly protein PilO
MTALFRELIALFRRRPFVCAALTLAVLLGGSNYFLWQMRSTAARENDEIRTKGESMLRALANRERIDTDIAALKTAIAYIEKNLLDEQSMEVNLGYFYKLEKPARVRLVRLNQLAPQPLDDKKIFKAVPFSMQISGPYRNVMSFMRALETGSRIIRIRSCTFEHPSSDASEYVLELTVEALAKI